MAGIRATPADGGDGRRGVRMRLVLWGAVACLLLLPLLGTYVLEGMDWDGTDFLVWGLMLAFAAGTYELGAILSSNTLYRAGFGVAILAGFLLVWINLAVGVIGSEDHPANLMFFGVLAIGAAGALLARFRAAGMAQALVATALAHGLVGVIALVGGLDTRLIVLMANGFFVLMWLVSATLFRLAAQGQGAEVPRQGG